MIGLYFGGNSWGTKVFSDLMSIDFDATLDELHEWKNEVTQNPVETGSPIADHVIEKPDKLRLQGVITNSPLRGPDAGKYFGGQIEVDRVQDKFETIYILFKQKEKIIVYTKHKIYTDMVIESVSIPRNAQIGEEIQFTMELVNIRLVATQLVTLPPGISAKKAASTVGKKVEPQKAAGQKMLDQNYKTRANTGPSSVVSNVSTNIFDKIISFFK